MPRVFEALRFNQFIMVPHATIHTMLVPGCKQVYQASQYENHFIYVYKQNKDGPPMYTPQSCVSDRISFYDPFKWSTTTGPSSTKVTLEGFRFQQQDVGMGLWWSFASKT